MVNIVVKGAIIVILQTLNFLHPTDLKILVSRWVIKNVWLAPFYLP